MARRKIFGKKTFSKNTNHDVVVKLLVIKQDALEEEILSWL